MRFLRARGSGDPSGDSSATEPAGAAALPSTPSDDDLDLGTAASMAAVEGLAIGDPVLASAIESEIERLDEPEGQESLGSEIKRGAAWSSLSSVALRLGTFVMGIVAARLIAPDEFGVFTVALTVHAIILNVSEIGVGAYLVRHTGSPDKVAPTVLTISLTTSAVLAGLMFLTAPYLATSLGSADAAGPIRVLSITVLLAGPSAVPNALLVRSFRQDKLFLSQILSFVSSNGMLVVLAIAGSGAYALAWSRVAGHLVQTIALLLLAGRIFLPGFDRALFPKLLKFGLPLAGFSLLGFATGNIDFVVIGRELGSEELGLFSLAYNVSSWGFGFISPVVAAVAMPAFARVRHDRERMPAFLRTGLQTVLCLALPVSAMTVALSGPLVESIYGDKWLGAASALAVTAIYGALRVPSDLFISTGIAFGRTKALFLIQIVYFVALIPLMLYGVGADGIVGASWAHAVGIVLTLLPGLFWMIRSATGTSISSLLVATLPPLGAACAAGAVAYLISSALHGPWLRLIAGGLGGMAVYFAVLGPWAYRAFPRARELWRDGDRPAADVGDVPTMIPSVPSD